MVLNYIWIAFFILAFVVALGETIFNGNLGIWSTIMNSSFDSAAQAFQISIGLTGILSLWMGLMRIGEKGGVIQTFGKLISPLFVRLFPGIPKGHPAMGSIFMNVSANMLGLDNAATPLGLKAMQELQSLNDKKDTATDAMLMFLVLNASGLCVIPIGVMMYRAQCGAANPTDVFMPILIATFISTLVGIIALCVKQKINMLDKVIISWLGGLTLVVGGTVWFLSTLDEGQIQYYSSFAANFLLFSVIIGFIVAEKLRQSVQRHMIIIRCDIPEHSHNMMVCLRAGIPRHNSHHLITADQIEKGVFHEHRSHVPRQQERADGAVLHRLRRDSLPPQHLRHQYHRPHGGGRHRAECPLLLVLCPRRQPADRRPDRIQRV